MDNAGENKKLAARCASSDWKFDITIEWTPRDTPQMNGVVEIAIYNMHDRGHAMMHRARIPHELRHLLLPRAIMLAVQLDGLTLV
jgi:hypothetical protein